MLVLIVLIVVTVVLWGGFRGFGLGTGDWRWRMRVAMALAFLLFGVDHVVNSARYMSMMPVYLPWHAEIVFVTGICEIAGALGLVFPPTRRLAGIALAAYLVAVLPANLENARNAFAGATVPGLPTEPWYYLARLALQPLFILWALYAAGILPRTRTDRRRGLADTANS